jgi:hypothetical protein
VSFAAAARAGEGGATALTESFFACPGAALAAAPPTAARVVAVDGRAPVVLVDEASDARGAARAADASAAGRVVRGRFAVVVEVVVEGAIDCLVVVFPGDGRVDVAAAPAAGVLRTVAGFLFSSPDVTDDNSGSTSEAVDLEASPALLAVEPAMGRVGGLFRLDPTVLTREVELGAGLDAVVEARAVLVDTVGRRAPAVALPLVVEVVGRRGGMPSLLAEPAFEAILRRTEDAGVEGAGNFFLSGLPV